MASNEPADSNRHLRSLCDAPGSIESLWFGLSHRHTGVGSLLPASLLQLLCIFLGPASEHRTHGSHDCRRRLLSGILDVELADVYCIRLLRHAAINRPYDAAN